MGTEFRGCMGWIGCATWVALAVAVLAAEPALGSDTGMPWEAPLTRIQNSMTGPVALAVSILGIFVCGALLIFGGDMQEFVRRLIYVVLAIGLLVSASSLISLLFGFSSAVM